MMETQKTIDYPTLEIFPTLIEGHDENRLMDEELAYLAFFGLRSNPFPVAPDDENFYFSEHIDQIVTELVHGIVTRKGFMVLTGDIGLGKTTISRWIMNILEEKQIETSLVLHTTFQDVELLAEVNRDFGINADGTTFSDHMWALNQFLLDQNRNGRNCAIIIDDAQNLSRKSLELIRMISNLEAYHEKLVQILLVGQSELMDKLNTKELRQLRSRIIINKAVQPLAPKEIKNYLQFKLNAAGNKGLLSVEANAFGKLYQFTKGNFRQLNTLMDRCLYAAFLNNTKTIDRCIVKLAQADLHPAQPQHGPWVRARLIAVFALVLMAIGIGIYMLAPLYDRQTEQPLPATGISSPIQSGHTDEIIAPPAPVKDFLDAYDLVSFAPEFAQALKTQQLDAVAAAVYAQTGYKLIRLNRLPADARQAYDVLAYPDAHGHNVNYYLFWKPTISFPKFYYRLEGEHVYILQEMLAIADLYKSDLDGIVGKHLMQAVLTFQEQVGISVTGYPDPTTIFLLSHATKRNSP
jgi:general secretion pathway protein A